MATKKRIKKLRKAKKMLDVKPLEITVTKRLD
jgi:hypothetical protein